MELNLYNIVIGFVLVLLMVYFLQVYLSRRHMVKLANALPSLKLKFYHFCGHLQLVFNHRVLRRNNGISPHVYDFISLNGYNYLFAKENCANIWQMMHPFVTVFKADSVEAILSHSTELKKAWFYEHLHAWLGTGLLTSHDDKWRRRRKLLTPAFHFNILKDFLLVFNKQSMIFADILQRAVHEEFVDVVPLVTNCSLDIICESILGKEVHSQTQESNKYVKAVTHLTSSAFERVQSPWLWNDFLFRISPPGKRNARNINIVQNFTKQLIQEKKEVIRRRLEDECLVSSSSVEIESRRKRALLDLLLEEHLKNDDFLNDEGIREEVDTFTFEGHDTTSAVMSWTLYLLGLHPWIQDKAHQELDAVFDEDTREATIDDIKNLKYLECVIKETLRLYPSVPAFGRMLRTDVNVGGHTVPAGSSCLVNVYQLHRNPEVFPDPEKFDPERFTPENSAGRHPFAYVPFSAGPRNCIGQRFAMLEAKTVLSSVLRRFQVRSLDPRDKVLVADEIVLRPPGGLRIQIRERSQTFDFHSVYYRP